MNKNLSILQDSELQQIKEKKRLSVCSKRPKKEVLKQKAPALKKVIGSEISRSLSVVKPREVIPKFLK